jgi:hypothetical protein
MKRGVAVLAPMLAIWIAASAGCGYHVAGRANTLPKTVRTIAIPAFTNNTTRYRLTAQLPTAIAREFIARTRYQVVTDVNDADAVLSGTVLTYNYYAATYDPETSRASAAQVSVFLDVTLRERATGTVLFSRNNMEFRERYEISVDPNAYFEESDTALNRVSRDVARTVVSAVLERF